MKKLLIAFCLVSLSAYSFSLKKFFEEDLKYNAHFGIGTVGLSIDNELDSDYDFTFLAFGGGASYKFNEKYTFFATLSLSKFTNLDYTQGGLSGSQSVNSVYGNWYFGAVKKLKNPKLLMTIGYDNLTYFVASMSDIIEPVRLDRPSAALTYIYDSKWSFSGKAGLLIPLIDDASGIDFNLSAKYFVKEDKKISVSAYIYKAMLKVEDYDSDSSSFGVSAGYQF